MRRSIFLIVLTATVVAIGAVAEAQDKRPKLRSVVVQLDDTATVIRGRLISLDADRVTLLVKNDRTSLPLDRVVRITAKRRDSIRNGAYIGALIGGVLCSLNCGQGLDRASDLPLAVASATGVWGAAGAGIDALNRDEEVIYQRPRP